MSQDLQNRLLRIRQATELLVSQNQQLQIQLNATRDQLQQETLQKNAAIQQISQVQNQLAEAKVHQELAQNQYNQLLISIQNLKDNHQADLIAQQEKTLTLAQQIDQLNNTIEMQKNMLSELKEENKLIKLAKNLSPSDSDDQDLKNKINELVKDIDRCIDLLNE